MNVGMQITVQATKPDAPGDAPMILLRLGEDTYLFGVGGGARLVEALEKEIQEAKSYQVSAKA